LLVDNELLRAIRTESAVAIKHWFGVSTLAVWKWRKAFGIGQFETEGSRRLHQAVSTAAAAALQGQPLTLKQIEVRRRRPYQVKLGAEPKAGIPRPMVDQEGKGAARQDSRREGGQENRQADQWGSPHADSARYTEAGVG
jgi:hypothetical protein